MIDTREYDFNDALKRLQETVKSREQEYNAWRATIPNSIPCAKHPEVIREFSELVTRVQSEGGKFKSGYKACPLCEDETRLHSQGVPSCLLHATLENWNPGSDSEKPILETVKEFRKIRRGFLVLLGKVGTGKSHLAVGVQRDFKSAWFIRQETLLLQLRQTYRDRLAEDPIEVGKRAGLMVLDEVGITGGGKDELPMLNEILGHRYDEFKPTILTGNITLDALPGILGDRVVDRIRESAFAIVTLSGTSKRSSLRQTYLQRAAYRPATNDP